MRQLDMLARFESLRLHVALLNHDWNEFKVLFVNKDPQTVAALNLEPYFFFDHQRLAYYQIVQTIANLIDTDPAVLSLETLQKDLQKSNTDCSIVARLGVSLTKVRDNTRTAWNLRSFWIAHANKGLMLDPTKIKDVPITEIDLSLRYMKEYLITFADQVLFCDLGESGFTTTPNDGAASRLLKILATVKRGD